MFGDFNTSIFSTAPTRGAGSPSSPIGPVGGSQRSLSSPGGNALFTGAFNVTAPFPSSGSNFTENVANDHAALSLNGFPRSTQGFQVNQPTPDPPQNTDVTQLFKDAQNRHAGMTGSPNAMLHSNATGTSMPATALMPGAVMQGYPGPLNTAYLPMRGSTSLPEMNMLDHRQSRMGFGEAMDTSQDRARRQRGPGAGTGVAAFGKDTTTLHTLALQQQQHDEGRLPRHGQFKDSEADLHGRSLSGGALAQALRKSRPGGGLSRDLVKRQTTKAEAQELLTRTVHMRCLPPALSQAQLAKFLHDCGPFDRVRVCTNGRANQKWVYGFVEFTDTHGADALLARSGYQMGADTDGKPLWIKCIRAAQPIQDLLPSDAETTRGRPCQFGSDDRAQQSIADLAATPAGALWEQAKATMSPGGLLMGDRHLSEDAVSSGEDAWEPSDHSLHTPHLFKEEAITSATTTTTVTPRMPVDATSRAGLSTASLVTMTDSRNDNTNNNNNNVAQDRFLSPMPVSAEDANAILATVWKAHQRLSDSLPLCGDAAHALQKLQTDAYVAILMSATCANMVAEEAAVSMGVDNCLAAWTTLEHFMTAHEPLLATVPYDPQEGVSASAPRGSRRGLALFVFRFVALFSRAALSLRALASHHAAFRAAVRDLLSCLTAYFPTPSASLGRPGLSTAGGRRGKTGAVSSSTDVFLWSLNLIALLVSLATADAVAVEQECLATVLAAYVSASHAECALFPELGDDIYSLKEEQLANMLTHALVKKAAAQTQPEVLSALVDSGRSGTSGLVLSSQFVRNFPAALHVL